MMSKQIPVRERQPQPLIRPDATNSDTALPVVLMFEIVRAVGYSTQRTLASCADSGPGI